MVKYYVSHYFDLMAHKSMVLDSELPWRDTHLMLCFFLFHQFDSCRINGWVQLAKSHWIRQFTLRMWHFYIMNDYTEYHIMRPHKLYCLQQRFWFLGEKLVYDFNRRIRLFSFFVRKFVTYKRDISKKFLYWRHFLKFCEFLSLWAV